MSSVKSNCVKLINKATCPSPSSEWAPMYQLDPQEAAVHLCKYCYTNEPPLQNRDALKTLTLKQIIYQLLLFIKH